MPILIQKNTVFLCSLLMVFVFVSSSYAQFFTAVSNVTTLDGTFSSGCSWGDYNNDGAPDLFVCNVGGNNLLYQNNGDGSFTQITSGVVVTDGGNSLSAVWSDYDNDGNLDLYVSNRGSGFPITAPAEQNFLYKNDGAPNFTFTKITTELPATDANYTWSSSWVDYNNDGWLDLHVPENLHSADDYFYKNENGSFVAQALPFILLDGDDPSTGVASWIDMDNDGDSDVLLAKSGRFLPGGAEDHRLFLSQLTETGTAESFSEILTGNMVTHFDKDFQASWGDYDNDGKIDVLLGNFDGPNYFYHNDGGGVFTRITNQPVATDNANTLGSCWGDYDNDGDLDLFVSHTNGTPVRVFRNEGGGNFSQMGFSDLGSITTSIRSSNSCALADYDNDGDLDFYLANSAQNGNPQNNDLYRNDQGNINNWLQIKCVGVVANRSAVGSKVRLKATIFGQTFWQYREITGSPTGDRGQNNQRVHFGLGDANIIDSLVIGWASGNQDVYLNVAINKFTTATENGGLVGIIDENTTPNHFKLHQNYPNPFNPSTTIGYSLSKTAHVSLKIYNLLGEEVHTLVNSIFYRGDHTVAWNGKDGLGNAVGSGMYFYRIEIDGQKFVQNRKMVLLK